MTTEAYQPPESDELARTKTIASMVLRYEMYNLADLEGPFDRFNQGDTTDEV